jgi:hypothetical protein
MPRCALLVALLALYGTADAKCVCRCVDGEMRAVCSSSIDIEPVCPPRVCPVAPPSVAPIQPPRVPPVGTSVCRQVQVYNERTRRHVWRELCR